MLNVSTTLDETIINVRDTAITAGLELGEVNALALALGLSMALNTAGEFIKTGEFSSDTGEFTECVSSTSVYCTDITVYEKATVYKDIDCRGNIYSTLPGGTLYCETVDTDYAKVSLSLSAPRISTNYATVNTSLSSPHIDCTGAVLCDSMTPTNGIICDSSIQCDSLTSTFAMNASSMQCKLMNIGNASMRAFGDNLTIDVQNPNAYMYFKINGETVASLTCRNQLLLDDSNNYGLDMRHNDSTNVYFFNCSNSIITIYITRILQMDLLIVHLYKIVL